MEGILADISARRLKYPIFWMEKHISRMFNCYSGSGVAGGQAPQLHFPCSQPASQPAQRTTLPPPRTACLYFSTAIPLFPPFSPSLPSNLFHPSTVHRLLFSRPPLAHVRFSPRRYQLICPLWPSSTGCVHPSRDGISGRNFVSTRSPYVFISQGSQWTCKRRIYALCVLRLASIVYWILIQGCKSRSLQASLYFCFLVQETGKESPGFFPIILFLNVVANCDLRNFEDIFKRIWIFLIIFNKD